MENPQPIIFPGQWQKIKSKLLGRSFRGNFLPRRQLPSGEVARRSDAVIFPGQNMLVDHQQRDFDFQQKSSFPTHFQQNLPATVPSPGQNAFNGQNLGSIANSLPKQPAHNFLPNQQEVPGHNLEAQQPKSLPRPNFLPEQPVSAQPTTFSIQNSQIDHGLSLGQGESIPIYISQVHTGGRAYHIPAYVSHNPGLNFHTHDGSFHAHTQLQHSHQHEDPKNFSKKTIHAHTQLHHPHQHEVPEFSPTLENSKSTIQAQTQLHHQPRVSAVQTEQPSTLEISKDFSQNTIQGFEAGERLIPDQVFPGHNFQQIAANQDRPNQLPSSVNHLGLSQQPSLAQTSETEPSQTANPPPTKPSLPLLPSRASPASAQPVDLPHEHLEETFGADTPLIEPFFPILPPASISPVGPRTGEVEEEKARGREGAVGSGGAERAEATVIETESRPLKAEVAVPFVSGRFPPRTRLQGSQEKRPSEAPRAEAPRQGVPREGPKLDFMELLH